MYKTIIDGIKPDLENTIEFLKNEFKKIRAGRSNPSLVEDIMIDCFGQKLPLKQLASISCPDIKQILIQPWDASYLQPIEKSIGKSDLGINPIIEKNYIRIVLPPLSEEYRQNLLRLVSSKQEEARKRIRYSREKAWSEIQDAFRDGEVSEDDKFKAKEELQKIIDDYNKKIKELGDNKENEIKN